jgi:putative SOS response-associated peptidase YedK
LRVGPYIIARRYSYAIARRDGRPLAIAGLWEAFRRPDGEIVRTYCIITVAATGRDRRDP